VSELVELLGQLVAINSVNPGLDAQAAGEGEIASHVAGWLQRAGLEVEIDEVLPGRPNVVARAQGSSSGQTLLLNAHMDTVGAGAMDGAFTPRIADGRLFGRGAYDMKAGLAAVMVAGAAAARLQLAGDVVVAAVIDEELASAGTERLAATTSADAAIVTEPTELEVVVAHKGFAGFEIRTQGRAAHGSRPDLGIDAIAKMGGVLIAIARLDAARRSNGDTHPLVGTGSAHASLIEGGQEYSSYPDRCTLVGERRLIPGETAADAESELREILAQLAHEDEQFDATLTMGVARAPFELPRDEPFAETVRRCAAGVLGTEPALAGRPFWTDAALLAEAGIPTVLLGPGGDGAHAAVEWVSLEDCERLVEILVGVAREVCG
jgi:acetylornithine deacetylase